MQYDNRLRKVLAVCRRGLFRTKEDCRVLIPDPLLKTSQLWLTVLCSSCLVTEICSALLMYQLGAIYEAVSTSNLHSFVVCLTTSAVIVAVSSLIRSTTSFAADMTSILCRRNLVECIHESYFYSSVVSSIENEDQRLVCDTKVFSENLSILISKITPIPFIVLFYVYYLWTMFGVVVPLSCIAFFVVGQLSTRWIVSELSDRTRDLDAAEGNFRFLHSLFREHKDIVSLINGNCCEKHRAERMYESVLSAQLRLVQKRFSLLLVTNLFAYSGATVNYAILGLTLLLGLYNDSSAHSDASAYRAALLSRGSYACMSLIGGFTTIIECSTLIVDLIAFGERLFAMLDDGSTADICPNSCLTWFKTKRKFDAGLELAATSLSYSHLENISLDLELLDHQNDACNAAATVISPIYNCREIGEMLLSVANLRLEVSESHGMKGNILLADGINFSVQKSMRLLIVGESGAGKSTLLKVLVGLRSAASSGPAMAKVLWSCQRDSILVCPQLPYLFESTVVEALSYSSVSFNSRDSVDPIIIQATMKSLEDTGLLTTIQTILAPNSVPPQKLEALLTTIPLSWTAILSTGQMQLLGIARIKFRMLLSDFLVKPRVEVVLLDESTCSLDEGSEKRIYDMLIQSCPTVITIGHRSSLFAFHSHLLKFDVESKTIHLDTTK